MIEATGGLDELAAAPGLLQVELAWLVSALQWASSGLDAAAIAIALARWQKNQPPAASTFGIFLNPIKNGKIVSGYGPRVHPIYNELKQHNGLDIDGAMGEPMRASESGLVLVAEERGGYGLTVVIDHGNQLATLYGHMSRLDVRPGDLVSRGQQIGLVGSTMPAAMPRAVAVAFEADAHAQSTEPMTAGGPYDAAS